MKKLVNFRFFLFLLLFYCSGILSGFCGLVYTNAAAAIFFAALFFILAPFLLSFAFGKLFSEKIFDFLKKYRVYMLVFAAFSAFGYFAYNFAAERFDNSSSAYGGITVYAKGEIFQSRLTDNGGYYIVENAAFTADGKTENIGTIFVYIYDAAEVESGGKIALTGAAEANKIFSEGRINSFAYRNNIKYSFFINAGDYTVTQEDGSLFNNIRNGIRDKLTQNMREDNALISYALITGDSLQIDEDIKKDFSDTQIAHVLCVSGLHIGVFVAAEVFILNKLKAGKITQIIIITALLLFYGAICGFAPSVVRATVMAEVYLISRAAGEKYDMASSVSFSALIILLFTPLMLFDAGFLLSFGAVLGITLLYRRLFKLLKFIPRKLRAPLCLTLSAQAGVLPLIAYYYNKLTLISVVVNVAVVPLISVIYVMLLVLLPITAVMPFLSFLFYIPQGLTEGVKAAASLGASLDAEVYLRGFGIGAALFYLLIIAPSGYLLIKRKSKAVLSAALAVFVAVSAALYNLPFDYGKTSVSAIAGGRSSLLTSENTVYYICYGKEDIEKLKEHLKKHGISKLHCAVFSDCAAAARALPFIEEYGIEKYIMPRSDEYVNTFAETGDKIKYLDGGERYAYKSAAFTAYILNNECFALSAETGGLKALYLCGGGGELPDYRPDILFAPAAGDYSALQPKITVIREYEQDNNRDFFSAARRGGLIFEIKNDRIVKRFSYGGIF